MEFNLDKNKSDIDIYEELSILIDHVIIPTDRIISNLSNFIALFKDAFTKISWIGFYITNNNKLFLGPFQGRTACTEIQFGKGVCGTSAQNQETIIVDDVNQYPNHIACDSNSNSEIVIPIIINGLTWGVLDVDSYSKSSFSEVDKKYLEIFVSKLVKNVNLTKFVIS